MLDIIQDREGNLWFATLLGGLTRFDTETIQLLTEEPVSEILTQDRQDGLMGTTRNGRTHGIGKCSMKIFP